MFRRLLNTNSKKMYYNMEMQRFETGNWKEYIENYKIMKKEGREFHYNNVPTYNEGEALNELEGTMPGIEIDSNNKIIPKNK